MFEYTKNELGSKAAEMNFVRDTLEKVLRLAEIKDQKAGITHTYEYDSLGRLIRAWQKDTATGEKVHAVENLYDSYGSVTGLIYRQDAAFKSKDDAVGFINKYLVPIYWEST